MGESIFKDIPDGLELRSKALPPNERIKVKNGDLVGVYYDHNRAHLTYDECSDTSVHVYTIDHFKKQIYKLEDIAKFSEDIGCAIFSMRAIIAPNSVSITSYEHCIQVDRYLVSDVLIQILFTQTLLLHGSVFVYIYVFIFSHCCLFLFLFEFLLPILTTFPIFKLQLHLI